MWPARSAIRLPVRAGVPRGRRTESIRATITVSLVSRRAAQLNIFGQGYVLAESELVTASCQEKKAESKRPVGGMARLVDN